MARSWRTIRARLLTPDRAETRPDVRGFHIKDRAARERLEAVGANFLNGFEAALEAPDTDGVVARLERVDRPFRGFAYEGATMGLAILDGLTPGGSHRVDAFLAGPAAPHIYMAYVGVGWAYAKLPRFRWPAVTPADPLLRWLVLDGYGFYHAFFNTDRYVHRQYVDHRFRWPPERPVGYAQNAIDQGIGRASWFVAGADADLATVLFERFPPARRADLWSGLGLAATYAGAADEAELKAVREAAGDYRPQLAQGSAFGAKARLLAGLVTEHTPVATGVFCGRTPEEAAAVTDAERVDLPADGELPAYEIWRRRIQSHFE